MPIPEVVVDTNVFIAAAFKPRSDSARVVEAVRAGTLRLVWSEPTRKETKALLSRIPPTSWEAVAELFQEENRRSIEFEPTAFATVKDPEGSEVRGSSYVSSCRASHSRPASS